MHEQKKGDSHAGGKEMKTLRKDKIENGGAINEPSSRI
jgi:hypothetical protein